MKTTYRECEVEIYYVSRRPIKGDYGASFIIVAKQGYGGKDWRAYCGLTRTGTDDTWQAVIEDGDKVRRDLAEFLFPDFAKKYEWRN